MDGRGERGSGALIAAGACTAVGWLLWIVMQIIARDPFPPEISVSQYGLGPGGWVFSVWAVALAAAPLLVIHTAPVPGPARILLWIGFAGALVMAIVRTDEGAGAMSWHAKVHTTGAVIAMVCLPLGILFALRAAGRRTRILARVLAIAAILVGALVLISAAGVDTAGIGAPRSWALWEGLLIVIEMLLVTLYAAATLTTRMNVDALDR